MGDSRSSRTKMDDELLTVAEAAALVKKTAQTVRGWIHQGLIPHEVTPGGQFLVWRSTLLESRANGGAARPIPSWQQEMADRRASSRADARAAALGVA